MLKKVLISAAVLALVGYAAFLVFGTPAGQAKVYGKPIDPDTGEVVTIASILANPSEYEGVNVIVEAKTGHLCLASGCWITLTDGSGELFVQFYDFTVSLSSNQSVRVQGQIRMQNQSPYLAGSGLETVR